MLIKDKILELTKQNQGLITTAQLDEAGIARGNLKPLLEQGLLERSARGVYVLPERWEDDIFNLQYRFSRGIFSCETALFLWGLSDQTPSSYTMTFPLNYNTVTAREENIHCLQVKHEWYEIGLSTVLTPGDNLVKVYNPERSLCDILRPNSHSEIRTISDAFKQYISSRKCDIPLLSAYSKIFKVEGKVRSYLEVLL